jgi:hypothetical protein
MVILSVIHQNEMSSGFRSNCYRTGWNWANTENIRIGLGFAVLAQ